MRTRNTWRNSAYDRMTRGHEDVHARFLNALSRGKLHHAWLLHGPSGIGKAALGFEMARTYLCERNYHASSEHEACGACHACHMMAAGSHPDFLPVERERDEKKKRLKRDVNVGQARDLLSFLSLSGAQSERRVVLVREAGKMNVQAANALLKGLEEPASGSLLILVCENVMDIPATIRSRCLLQAMEPLNDDACEQVLRDMGIEGEVLEFAVQLAHGQPGKAGPLAEAEIADALLEWNCLNQDLARADIGCLQDWIGRYVRKVPHALLADVVMDRLEPALQANRDFHAFDTLMDTVSGLAAWPVEVRRRTLNPATTLLAHMLSLRIALRSLDTTLKQAVA